MAINKFLEKYSKNAHLEYVVTPHMARHTFCSNLIKEGQVDPKTVALLSGHSSVDTLYRFYVNSSAEDKQNAVDNLQIRSEEHTSELQSRGHLVCRLLL